MCSGSVAFLRATWVVVLYALLWTSPVVTSNIRSTIVTVGCGDVRNVPPAANNVPITGTYTAHNLTRPVPIICVAGASATLVVLRTEGVRTAPREGRRTTMTDTVDPPLAGVRVLDLAEGEFQICLLYTSPSPRDRTRSRMPSSA